jgi:hypothetical protein
MYSKVSNILWSSFFLIVILLTFFGVINYQGNKFIYLLFSVVANFFLYFSFRKQALFFDTFLGIFLWLGIWMKMTIHIAFYESRFSEGLHGFSLTPGDFDEALIVASTAFLALMFASKIREKFFIYPKKVLQRYDGIYYFYKNHRNKILFFYIVFFVFIAISNFYLGIYQRGEITQTFLPYGLNGIYKWLLLFGLSTFGALLLTYEFALQKKTTYFVPILVLVETCVTNISLLSRGMVLNGSGLGYGMIKEVYTQHIKTNMKFWIGVIFSFIFLFLVSVIIVNNVREYKNNLEPTLGSSVEHNVNRVVGLFVNRWVGAEGLLAVVHSDKKGWELFNKAVHEKYNEHSTSFYDLNLINSSYKNIDFSKHHYMSLPGFIAFFYYTGSLLFVILMMIILSFFASSIEVLAYKMGGKSLILTSLFAEVMAYRFTHFGYVPMQSYLLFGTIVVNIFIIYGLRIFLNKIYHKEIISAK